jgi:D-alanine-D-alanine ligase
MPQRSSLKTRIGTAAGACAQPDEPGSDMGNSLMKPLIGLVYDLRSEYLAAGFSPEDVSEFDSDVTVESLEKTIRSLGFRVERIGNAKALCSRLVAGDRWDLVFNIAEGLKGRSREAQAPCILELYDIPYTMSDPLVNAAGLDKVVCKKLVRAAGLRTPDFHVVSCPADLAGIKLKYPLFVKPIAEGTGKGIDQHSRVENSRRLKKLCLSLLGKFRQPVLVEEYLPGREFTVGIVGAGKDARVIGTMEVEVLPSAGGSIYSYETKERCEEFARYSMLKKGRLKKEIEKLALASYVALECRDCGRVDVRLDAAGRPGFIEINTLPGLRPHHSDLPMIAEAEGISYKELIGAIIKSALKRARR